MLKTKSKRWKTILLVILGMTLLGAGVFIALWHDLQAILYNHALESYVIAQSASPGPHSPIKSGEDRLKMLVQATKMFDLSVRVYKSESKANWLERFLFPKPDSFWLPKPAFAKAIA